MDATLNLNGSLGGQLTTQNPQDIGVTNLEPVTGGLQNTGGSGNSLNTSGTVGIVLSGSQPILTPDYGPTITNSSSAGAYTVAIGLTVVVIIGLITLYIKYRSFTTPKRS